MRNTILRNIDWETSTNEIFAMFDKIVSDNESDIDNFLEDSETEYVAEDLEPETKEHSHNKFTPEADFLTEGTTSCYYAESLKKKLK